MSDAPRVTDEIKVGFKDQFAANWKHGGFAGKTKVALGSIIGVAGIYDGVRRIVTSGQIDEETKEKKGGLFIGVLELGAAALAIFKLATHKGAELHRANLPSV